MNTNKDKCSQCGTLLTYPIFYGKKGKRYGSKYCYNLANRTIKQKIEDLIRSEYRPS